ncbi:MAG TPA: amidohydrolase [Terrimesophilobacter sp.]|nr:amidohydrolase [Terrimesophilobacter sp.]
MIAFTVDACWLDGWRGRTTLVADDEGFRRARGNDPEPEAHLAGTVLPGFRDAHVHLGLVDGTELLAGGIAAVDDFGWELDLARTWPTSPGFPRVTIAGQLLTAPGGYPTASGWAPPGAACEIAAPDDAPAAVDRQLEAGAAFIKVALNADAGPVLDDATLARVVEHAHARGVTVVAHAQGKGQAARAFAAGVDVLAHAPWSERLSDELLGAMAAGAMAAGATAGATAARPMTWVSTLDIHGWGARDADFVVASDNVRRFHAAGGRIRYGTDLGNGPLPVGINARELLALEHAGLGLDALAAAIATGAPGAPNGFGRHLSVISAEDAPDRAPDPAADPATHPAAWLATARLIDHDRLKEHLR